MEEIRTNLKARPSNLRVVAQNKRIYESHERKRQAGEAPEILIFITAHSTCLRHLTPDSRSDEETESWFAPAHTIADEVAIHWFWFIWLNSPTDSSFLSKLAHLFSLPSALPGLNAALDTSHHVSASNRRVNFSIFLKGEISFHSFIANSSQKRSTSRGEKRVSGVEWALIRGRSINNVTAGTFFCEETSELRESCD
jgi:hypothetical protein